MGSANCNCFKPYNKEDYSHRNEISLNVSRTSYKSKLDNEIEFKENNEELKAVKAPLSILNILEKSHHSIERLNAEVINLDKANIEEANLLFNYDVKLIEIEKRIGPLKIVNINRASANNTPSERTRSKEENSSTNAVNNFNVKNSVKFFTIKYPDNSIYSGYLSSDWKKTNYGELKLNDGGKYVGQFKDDMFEGYGRLIFNTGEYYEGDFIEGKAEGYGKYVYSNNIVYTGYWVNNIKCGKGVETLPDGSMYSGDFLNDVKHGFGICKWADNSVYEGMIQNNLISGIGKLTYQDGKCYQGEFKNKQIEGIGLFKWPDDKYYIGEYKLFKKSGVGRLVWNNGKRYDGYWLDGNQNGYGACYFKDKIIFLGEWRNGKNIRRLEPDSKININNINSDYNRILKQIEDKINNCVQFLMQNNIYT